MRQTDLRVLWAAPVSPKRRAPVAAKPVATTDRGAPRPPDTSKKRKACEGVETRKAPKRSKTSTKPVLQLPRGVRPRDHAARTLWLAYVAERFPDVDVSGVTAEWWKGNVTNAKSRLAFVCGCGAKRSVSWKHSKQGQVLCRSCAAKKRCENRPVPLERSFASYEGKTAKGKLKRDCAVGWNPRDEFLNCNSKRCFQCDACSHTFESTLGSIAKGKWCAACSGNIAWNQRLPELRRICDLRDVDLVTPDDQLVGLGAFTKPHFRCRQCKRDVHTTTVSNFVTLGNLGCGCSENIAWNQRLPELRRICDRRDVDLVTPDDQLVGLGAFTKPHFRCRQCKRDVHTTTVSNFVTLGNLGCGCSENIAWNQRLPELRRICDRRDVDLVTPDDQLVGLGAFTKPHFRCRKCKRDVHTTTVSHFVNGNLGCGCRHKTQAAVQQRLARLFDDTDPRVGQIPVPLDAEAAFDLGRSRMDHAVARGGFTAYWETDGGQHTEDDHPWRAPDTLDRDLAKQRAVHAARGALARLHVPWLQEQGELPWLDDLFRLIHAAQAPGVLVVLDLHEERYAAHVEGWPGPTQVVRLADAHADFAKRTFGSRADGAPSGSQAGMMEIIRRSAV